ncbi:serine/threonine protein kinase [Arthrobacter sp. V1I9]|jgi:serine/threonine protein kinase|uniref:serine/threonine-protein kinase n=1 Tax=Arthrobacter sp. V1I9 TaxID=3042275 RepID=UPI00278EEF9C|nr:serine/threonine-protein kinase [Arthrobacter sp. V1I9]MDQ0871237.1 serine/threonine protein kinase [Arthrobacter sp. V1I9]
MTSTAAAPQHRGAGLPSREVVVAGRYELKERLGRGSLAEVFRAADLEGGPDVAVKVAVGDSEQHFERIRNEAAVLAGMNHPSIIRFISRSIIPAATPLAGRPFLVEELALGASLAAATRTGLPRPGDVAGWARGLFGALAHLHGQGLVHRDIKPANLMLSGLRRSPVRIIDFGIAVAAGAAPEPGISSGTVHYMSPEQASGGPAQASWDVYAMGLVLLELLTGARAFPGTAIESLVARTLRSPEIPESLGPGWCTFLSALTAMDSAARPTADEAAVMAERLVPPADQQTNSACRRMAVFPARRIRQLV